MFAKLLKHEWRATRSIVALLCVIIIISGAVIGGIMHCMVRSEVQESNDPAIVDSFLVVEDHKDTARSEWTTVLFVLLLTAGVIAIAVCCAGSVFFLIYRFYKRCFTDEGYLTFTLPVSSHQILLSSLVNCILGSLVVILAAVSAGVFAALLLLMAFPQSIAWADVWSTGSDVLAQLWESFLENSGQFALIGFSSLFDTLSNLVHLMLAVTIGSMLVRKHKILAAVAVYYGISILESFAFFMFAFSSVTNQNINAILASPGVLGLFTGVAGYLLMHWLTSRKLNLV